MYKKKKIIVLATGGTLASVAPSRLILEYDAAAIPIEKLLGDLPELSNIADIHSEQITQINSENMTESTWIKLARRTQSLLQQDDIDGVVITHGTDTLEETAFFMNLVLKTSKTIVFTGAMRPANAISADGLRNLYNAVVLATSDDAANQGVLVTLNDEIHHARDVTKTNVNATNSFTSPRTGVMGYIHNEGAHFFRIPFRHYWQSNLNIDKIDSLPNTQIIYGYVGSRRFLVDACVEHGTVGIISAGVGLGRQSKEVMDALIEARRRGVHIVRGSRVKGGMITREQELDDKNDFIVSDLLNPQKGRILLALALLETEDTETIQQIFNEY